MGTDNSGNSVEYFAGFEGVYNGKPLIGYTFYENIDDLEYGLTAIDKLKALQTLAPYYGLGGGGQILKIIGKPTGLAPFKIKSRLPATSAGELGKMGELLTNATGVKTKISINGRNRIPDFLSPELKLLREIKNVKIQSYTRQLRDFCDFAKAEGYTYELWVRSTTKLTRPLRDAISSGDIILKIIPGS